MASSRALTFAASIHCAGMCGGFVAALGAFRTRRGFAVFLDQLLLQLGKASTYAFLGALAGAFGAALYRGPFSPGAAGPWPSSPASASPSPDSPFSG